MASTPAAKASANKHYHANRDRILAKRKAERAAGKYTLENFRITVRRYGMTVDDYFRLLCLQDGRCQICRTDVCSTGRRLSVDHDHETGRVRGLLCNNCNRAIGLLRDDAETLDRAAWYIRTTGLTV